MGIEIWGDIYRYITGAGDRREATGVAIIGGGGQVGQVAPDLALAADLLKAYDNFSGVVAGDFVTVTKTSNGQSILALSGSPETIGQSSIVLDKPAPQPCALEFEGSIVRNRHQFATAGVFADLDSGPEPTLAPINIVSIYQSTADNGAAYNAAAGNILTVVLEAALPQPGQVGAVYLSDWVHVDGLVDNRLNYPNLTVKFISPDRKTITAQFSDESALPSLAVTITPPLGSAKLHFYNNSSGAHDAATMRFTGTTDTSASLLTLFGGGDAQVSGTLLGDHRVTIGTTARVLPVSVGGEFELKATNRYRIECRPGDTAFLDRLIDGSAAWIVRAVRTAAKPGGESKLRPRMRLVRPPSMSRPVAKIVSVVKTASATATVTLDRTCAEAGLVTGNYITGKGVRDITNFPNLTAGAQITVTGANTFTVTWGSSATATSWGGVVILANGGQDMSNVLAQNIQAAVIDSTTGWLTLTGNTTWAGTQAGDYINVYGARVDTTGADVGIDGVWQVVSLSASALVLKPLFDIFARRVTPNITTLGATNCGGAVVLRTTIRAHDMMFEAWAETKVMLDGAGTNRADKALPVNILNALLTVTQAVGTAATRWFMTITDGTNSAALKAASTAAAAADVGLVVHPSPNKDAPIRIADVASAAITTTATTAAFTPTGGTSYEINIPVTAIAGTSPTLDVVVEESDDDGTNWFPVYAFPRITATGMYRSPKLPQTGNRVRYVQTIGGTGGPSFTRAINRLQCYDSVPNLRQIFDRALTPNTLNAVTASLNVQGCRNVQMVLNFGAITTTAPQVQLEGSDDNGLSWYPIGSPLLAVASQTVQTTNANIQAGLARGRVSAAGSGATLGYVLLKGF